LLQGLDSFLKSPRGHRHPSGQSPRRAPLS
jgi:hypothetical protein